MLEGRWETFEVQVERMKDTKLLGIITCAVCILGFWDSDISH